MRTFSVHVWCDLCRGRDGRREEATHQSVWISIGRARPRKLDLCDGHHKELIQPVLDVLAETDPAAAEPKPRARQRGWRRNLGPYRCQAGCQAAPLKHATSLDQHLRRIHDGMTLEEYVARYGELVPLTPEEAAETVVEVRCEVKGCEQVYSTALGNRWPQQAMVSHMRGHHGIRWKPGRSVESQEAP